VRPDDARAWLAPRPIMREPPNTRIGAKLKVSAHTHLEDSGRSRQQPVASGFAELVERAVDLGTPGRRALLGICGPPGVGKSTLAAALVDHAPVTAALVGMDGFHLTPARLTELGSRDRMGAIDTFDARGFAALVQRLRDSPDEIIYAPEFRRDLEISIAAAVPIEPKVQLVVIEGNYLLVPDEPWSKLPDAFDEIWYCERDENARVADLVARHHAYGKSPEEAERWVLESDQVNAELVKTTRSRADLIVRLDGAWQKNWQF
jgi:pantothenate kinase